MGIVVCIIMLLCLTTSKLGERLKVSALIKPSQAIWIARAGLALGLWNVLWYGLRHITSFWGIAGIVSGLALIIPSIIAMYAHKDLCFKKTSAVYNVLKALEWPAIAVLLVSFLLYAITLIQLNLGYPIIH